MLAASMTAPKLGDDGSPYLSIVACSRNDSHGEHLIERMQLFVDGIAEQAARFHLDCELILVDWNPPAHKPGLADVLHYPDGDGHLTSRVIIVPPELHAKLPYASALPLFQMIAKNVGIRRTQGRMVLSTNVDILFPDALMAWFADGALDEDVLYRADRADIKVPFGDPDARDPRSARALPWLRVNRRDGIYDGSGERVVPIYTGLPDLARYRWAQVRHRTCARELRPTKPPTVSSNIMAHASRRVASVWRMATGPKLHVNACGDFTLLSRRNWFHVGAHAEWPIYSWNLDALLLYQARATGLREVDLPDRFSVLHMDHSEGSGWTPDGAGQLFARMAERGIPVLTDDQLAREARRLRAPETNGRGPRCFTDPAWGHAGVELEERSFGSAPRSTPRHRTRSS